MKKRLGIFLKNVFPVIIACTAGAALLIFPKTVADGIRDGLYLLGNTLIPSIFPFTILSSYISKSNSFRKVSGYLEKPSQKIFKISGYGFTAFVLGILGGYPVGAKTVADFYKQGRITQNEAERLFYWCINPSPSFTVTAIGVFMLGNFQSGVTIYCSCILSSLTVGLLCRFLYNRETQPVAKATLKEENNRLADAVADGTAAILGISGWILMFSAVSALLGKADINEALKAFLSCTAEVTAGCRIATENSYPLNAITAVSAFGGFAVICQTSGYAAACSVKIKNLICAKAVGAVFAGVYTSFLLKIFPESTTASVGFTVGNRVITLYRSIPAAAILMIMCAALILEVDNRRKVC